MNKYSENEKIPVADSYAKLNVGCGVDAKPGWINLDSINLPSVDIVHDIEKAPFPFQDETFSEILCQDVLEHVEYIPVMKELYRILKRGGSLVIRVPHFTSKNNFIDPTHRKLFSINTWDYFVHHYSSENQHIEQTRSYYFDFAFKNIRFRRITFEKNRRFFFYNFLIERIVNYSATSQSLYESNFMSRIFPAENIYLELLK